MRVPQHPIDESELHPLVAAMGALAASADFESAARSIFEACRAVIRAESGYLAVLSNDGSADIAYLSVNGATHSVPSPARMGVHGLSREACRSGAARQCNDFSTSEWAHLLPDGHPPIDNVLIAPLVTDGRTVGVLTVANKPEGFSDADERLATALAQVAARALTKSRSLKALAQSEERLRTERAFLTRASHLLTATLDSQKTLDRLVSLAVPAFADWCALEILEDAGLGRFCKSTGAHPDPEVEAQLAEFRGPHPLTIDGDRVFSRVLRSATPALIPHVDHAAIDSVFAAREHTAAGDGLRATSFLAVPLYAEARPIGVLAWFRVGHSRPFDQRDVALAQEVGARAVTALQNSRLHESTERERARLEGVVQGWRSLRRHVRHLRTQVREALTGDESVAESRAFRAVLHQAQMVAAGDTTVLILGETGTGKELLARLIHRLSRRASRQLVPVNCASIPETLVESELFGFEKGAFTGAHERRPGKFEAASGGSLFLDEIGEFPLSAQAKLLRVLQDGRVQRVGSTRLIPVDVRVIAATNIDLEAAVREKRFRSDLYYRLGVFPIRLPALRDRIEDIRPMFMHFVAQCSQRLRRRIVDVDDEVFERLERHRWPGNVRELQNVAERAVILTQGTTIDASAIILPLLQEIAIPDSGTRTFADAERNAIVEALRQAAGRISGRGGAADRLGLKPTTLHAKMRKLGIVRREA